jgi:hypothetical protein
MKITYDFEKMLIDIYNSSLPIDTKASAIWLDKFDFIKLHLSISK